MDIGGFQKISFVDFPELVATVVFTQGCNWRCPWCHNPALVYPDKFSQKVPHSDIFSFLEKRKDQIDGVVISGGEPTLHPELADFLIQVKELGFKTKLDTNGSNPTVLKHLFRDELLDYTAMDLKGPLDKYAEYTGVSVDPKKILESVEIIKSSGVDYEFRTTLLPHLHTTGDPFEIANTFLHGAKRFIIQRYRETHSTHVDLISPYNKLVDEFNDLKTTLLRNTEMIIRS